MDDLYNFEVLSLVNKITQEVNNHLGIENKEIAEFIIDLHDQANAKLPDFKAKLKQNGAEFPDSFVDNVDRLILTMHPKHKKKAQPAASTDVGAGEETDKRRRMFPGLAMKDSAPKAAVADDIFLEEIGDLVSGRKTQRERPWEEDRAPKRQRRASPSPPRGRERYGRGEGAARGPPDERPILYKIYNGRVSGIKDFGAFVGLEGVAGRAEGVFDQPVTRYQSLNRLLGLVHVSNIQTGMRANSAADILTRNQSVKVKVIGIANGKISLSMKDVDQTSGNDLTPHLRIKSEVELEEERVRATKMSTTGANAMPLRSKDEPALPVRSTKRLTSPERWEIKQLISSGALRAADFPDLEEDFNNGMARAEIEEELDVEIREDEPPFLAGQTKRTLDLSPVKIVKAPDGSLNRAAMAGASLAKERRELRQQDANEKADSETRDINQPWLDPMAKETDKGFAQDMRGTSKTANEVPKWKEQTFNKATTFGQVTTMTIAEQRKSLPIFKLRDSLLEAIDQVCVLCCIQWTSLTQFSSIKCSLSLATLALAKRPKWFNTSRRQVTRTRAGLDALSPVVSRPCPWPSVCLRRSAVG